jgi:adenine-specific DNA-methyltransferase
VKPVATYQKLRGGYYTPGAIGEFLAHWAVRSPNDHVLEPSCGDGALLEAAAGALLRHGASPSAIAAQLHGVELDQAEAAKARKRLCDRAIPLPDDAIRVGDFFTYAREGLPEQDLFMLGDSEISSPRFDVVIGNPPFIRYQNFEEKHRCVAFSLLSQIGLRPNRLTNAWVPFVCVASMLLKEEGRLAMVIPAELLQVGYTAELRRFLSEHFCRMMLVTFRQLVFPDIQQEVVLLCAEKNGGKRTGINVVELDGPDDLPGHEDTITDPEALKPMDHSTEKWTQYYLTKQEIDLVRALRRETKLLCLGDLASVDVGVVTGLNEFFVLCEKDKLSAGLDGFTRSIVTRSAHLPGIVFRAEEWQALVDNQQKMHLLDAPAIEMSRLPDPLRSYIQHGEEKGWHRGYKCRIRKLWYVVPSLWRPDAFLLRQIHRYPKLIVNETDATSTDTIHRVRLHHGVDGRHLAIGCLNSLTFAFSEIVGRSYGGGVLELEPSEAERLPIPLRGAESIDFDLIHGLLRKDQTEHALAITDQVLLQDGLGLSQKETSLLRGIWIKLRDRRLNRKHQLPTGAGRTVRHQTDKKLSRVEAKHTTASLDTSMR